MISLHDVTVELPLNTRDAKTILHSISLDVRRGDWIALVGPNGSGKTTLLHTIAGLVAPAGGRVERSPRPRLSLLLQEPDNQFVTTSVMHELELSRPVDKPAAETAARKDAAVERFGLAHLADRNPHRLSGGEKQRLALATVWLQDPELLLLDEPIAYLDTEAAALCTEFVSDAHRRGVSVVWATPGGEELTRARRAVCLDGGRVVYDGSLDEMYVWADQARFGFVRPPLWTVAETLSHAAAEPGAAGWMLKAARDGAEALAQSIAPVVERVASARGTAADGGAGPGGDDIVRFSAVDFGYHGHPAVSGLDLSVRAGECVGLAGPNGAGKSTVLGLAAGVHEPQAGAIERAFERASDGMRSNAFYLFQSPERLFFGETVAAELDFGLKHLGLAPGERARRTRSALEAVGMAPQAVLERLPLSLSLGEMRRVAFAIALSLEPAFLLLDEPTSCLDPDGRSVLQSILAARRADGGATLVASQDASFLAAVCDRLVWLRDGQVEGETETAGGRLPPGAVWPGDPLPVLVLQDHLADLGVDVTPRALSAGALRDCLFGIS